MDRYEKLTGWVANEAADFGRRRVGNAVIDARRNLSGVYNRWYPLFLDLHRFFNAVSEGAVNHSVLLVLLLILSVIVIEPFCMVHLIFGILIGFIFLLLPISAADVALWPHTLG